MRGVREAMQAQSQRTVADLEDAEVDAVGHDALSPHATRWHPNSRYQSGPCGNRWSPTQSQGIRLA